MAASGVAVAEVSAAQVRYRLDDCTRYTAWLWAGLRRLGHQVSRPQLPDVPRSDLDAHAAETLVQVVSELASAGTDDPVVRCWRQATAIVGGTTEMTDGTIVTDQPDCPLWRHRLCMIEELDALLVLDRGGWQTGTRVRSHGVPPAVTVLGRLAAEAGLAPHRAVVAPAWRLDHDRHTLVEDPPPGYLLRYRLVETGLPATDTIGPVPADNLAIDLDPITSPATRLDTAPAHQRSAAPAVSPTPRIDTAPPRCGSSESGSADGDEAGDGEMEDLVQEFGRRQTAQDLPRPLANTDDPFRAAAIRRVWELRDQELIRAGDSAPHLVAERNARRHRPGKPPEFRQLVREVRAEQRDPLPAVAPWCPPDQHLVSGQPREHLQQWLLAVRRCTSKQRRVLDGFTRDTTIQDVRAVLAAEGFVEILDIHGNADAADTAESGHGDHRNAAEPDQDAGEPGRAPHGPVDLGTDPGDVDVIAVNASEGWLAVLHAQHRHGSVDIRLTVYYNTMAVDEELLTAAVGGSFHFDSQRRRTRILSGSIQAMPRHMHSGHSIRVSLAALRAFGDPVTPWIDNPYVHIGQDSTPPTDQRRILASLPASVHDLLGPNLQR